MSDNYTFEKHESRRFLLGRNEFWTGTLTVPANTTVSEGEILQTVNGKFVRSAGDAAETGLCVMVGSETNNTAAPVDVPVRVCISGKVNAAVLKIGAAAATAAQADLLRGWSVVPVAVHECGSAENI